MKFANVIGCTFGLLLSSILPLPTHAADFAIAFAEATPPDFFWLDAMPYDRPFLMIVETSQRDVTAELPITIVIKNNERVVFEDVIPDDAVNNCRSTTACALLIGPIADPDIEATLEIYAYNHDGEGIAQYIQPGAGYTGELDPSWAPSRTADSATAEPTATESSSNAWVPWVIVILLTVLTIGATVLSINLGQKKKKKPATGPVVRRVVRKKVSPSTRRVGR